MEILKLKPALKHYLWGGVKLKNEYQKHCEEQRVAESWELSLHADGECYIIHDQYPQTSLKAYIEQQGKQILGTKAKQFDQFPILIKLIDAQDSLSIQVHPDDAYAQIHEQEYGKNELWYIVDCEEDAFLYYGMEKQISKEQFQESIANHTLTQYLHKIPVQKGDWIYVPAKTIHAITKGILIYEIQQSSNSTYRVYDYGRKDDQGNTRPLHIQKAIDVSDLSESAITCNHEDVDIQKGFQVTTLKECAYFSCYRYHVLTQGIIKMDESSFCAITCIEGECVLKNQNNEVTLKKGESAFVGAGQDDIQILSMCTVIVGTL